MTQPQGGIWVRPRVEEIIAHTTGAIDDTFEIVDAAKLVRVHINFSGTPDAETISVSLNNSLGTTVASYSFDPTVEYPGSNEITLVFEGWKWKKLGGELNVTYDNTSELVTSIVASWEYDGN